MQDLEEQKEVQEGDTALQCWNGSGHPRAGGPAGPGQPSLFGCGEWVAIEVALAQARHVMEE